MLSRRTTLLALSLATLALPAAAAPPGKQDASSNKTIGKPLARVTTASAAATPRPLTLATPAKATQPAPFVRVALTQLAALSSEPPQLHLDPARGTLRRFDGRVPNPRGPGLRAAEALLAEAKKLDRVGASV